jgi:hypothetical protein
MVKANRSLMNCDGIAQAFIRQYDFPARKLNAADRALPETELHETVSRFGLRDHLNFL